MSVSEKLRAFRYATATCELPWKAVRCVDVSALRTEEPDLHLIKNLVSMLCSFSPTGHLIQVATNTDLLQLLQLMQAALQFTVWSQNTLKEVLIEAQTTSTVHRVSSSYVSNMERKLNALSDKLHKVTEERDTLSLASVSLHQSLAKMETTIQQLERQLAAERTRTLELLKVVEQCALQGVSAAGKGREILFPASPVPNHNASVADRRGRRCCPLCRRPQKGSSSRDDVSTSEDSIKPFIDSLERKRKPRAGRGCSAPSGGHYVDWQTFAQYLIKQTNPPAVIPPDDRNDVVCSPVPVWSGDEGALAAQDAGLSIQPLPGLSAPLDKAARSACDSFTAAMQQLTVQSPPPGPADVAPIQKIVGSAIETLEEDLQEQLRSVLSTVEGSVVRVANDVVQLRKECSGRHETLQSLVQRNTEMFAAALAANKTHLQAAAAPPVAAPLQPIDMSSENIGMAKPLPPPPPARSLPVRTAFGDHPPTVVSDGDVGSTLVRPAAQEKVAGQQPVTTEEPIAAPTAGPKPAVMEVAPRKSKRPVFLYESSSGFLDSPPKSPEKPKLLSEPVLAQDLATSSTVTQSVPAVSVTDAQRAPKAENPTHNRTGFTESFTSEKHGSPPADSSLVLLTSDNAVIVNTSKAGSSKARTPPQSLSSTSLSLVRTPLPDFSADCLRTPPKGGNEEKGSGEAPQHPAQQREPAGQRKPVERVMLKAGHRKASTLVSRKRSPLTQHLPTPVEVTTTKERDTPSQETSQAGMPPDTAFPNTPHSTAAAAPASDLDLSLQTSNNEATKCDFLPTRGGSVGTYFTSDLGDDPTEGGTSPALQHPLSVNSLDNKSYGGYQLDDVPASAALRSAIRGGSPLTPPTYLLPGELSTDLGQPVPCVHCRQRFPPPEHATHEATCDMRLLKCKKCGTNVVARVLTRHQCGPSWLNLSQSSMQSSGPSERASSKLLREAQKELQALLEEEQSQTPSPH